MFIRIKLYLSLIKHQALKIYGGVEVQFHAFITSAIDGVNNQLHAAAA
jgi:hypothetical protein